VRGASRRRRPGRGEQKNTKMKGWGRRLQAAKKKRRKKSKGPTRGRRAMERKRGTRPQLIKRDNEQTRALMDAVHQTTNIAEEKAEELKETGEDKSNGARTTAYRGERCLNTWR